MFSKCFESKHQSSPRTSGTSTLSRETAGTSQRTALGTPSPEASSTQQGIMGLLGSQLIAFKNFLNHTNF